MERAGPSKRSVPAVSLALLLTTRCRSLHRRVSRSFWRGRFGCVAAPAVAMPESDLEVTAMLSRATERVGLEWRKPPCPEPSRLDDWFLGVACAGSQRPAPGASLPDVHEELTGHGRHLLLPETDLLTPPPSPPSVMQLGVTGVPPVERSVAMQVCPYTVSTRQGKPCLLFRACRYSSGKKISTGSGCLCLWVPRGHGESWTNQLRTTLILPLASRQQWVVRECHQSLLTHPLPNYGSR